MPRRVWLLATLLLLCAVGACSRRSPAPGVPRLTVAAASSLRDVLPALMREFDTGAEGLRWDAVYASSGSLTAQIAQGAPFDVFLSADDTCPARLLAEGHAAGGSVVAYATGRLALWSPSASGLDVTKGLDVLRDPRVRRIAIAKPALAPYGRAAEQALENAGLLAELRPRLVLAQNVSQAAQYAQSGSADVALLALSAALSDPMREGGVLWTVPADMHAPIVHTGCIPSGAHDPELARRFFEFLRSERGRAIVEQHGFGTGDAP